MSSMNNNQLGYHYLNVSMPSNANTEQTLHTIKIPQLPKKDQQAFQSSTYETVKLKGPQTGVQLIEWSFDSHYLATKCESMPNAVWIWDMTTLELSTILIHLNNVKSFKFSPNSQTLVIGTGQSRVFVWTPKGACVVDLPRNEMSL